MTKKSRIWELVQDRLSPVFALHGQVSPLEPPAVRSLIENKLGKESEGANIEHRRKIQTVFIQY